MWDLKSPVGIKMICMKGYGLFPDVSRNFVILVANLRCLVLTWHLIPGSVFASRSAVSGNQANYFHCGVHCHLLLLYLG